MKKTSIIIILGMFLAFLFYQAQKSTDFQILKVNSPTEIVVDLNQNGVKDEEETITIKNVQSFSTKPDKDQSELAKKLNITDEDAIGLGFLAQNYAKETLDGKKVKLKDKNSQIIVDNKNYQTLLLNQGLAVKSYKNTNHQNASKILQKNIKKVQKLNLVIINNKNHKYHKLTCKYGLIAHNAQILPASQLTKDAKPCNFCLVNYKHKKDKKYCEQYKQKHKYNEDEIPNVKSPPAVFKTNFITIFLTDLTTTPKPSNNCSTPVCKALLNQINSAQCSIDLAIYGYSKVPALEDALQRALTRGVKIRFVYDTDGSDKNIYPDTAHLTSILTNNNSDHLPPIMHDKFFIFDNKTVLTGSANISNTDMSGFNSNAIILVESPKIANLYEQEFEQMYDGKFHKSKAKIKDKRETIGNSDFSVYFSPKDRAITTQVVPLINGAQKYIYIPAFLITHKSLTDSLIAAHKRGVSVKIILDAANTHGSHSKFKQLRENKIPVKTENYGGKCHSKSVIIDDTYTIIGSMNFSNSGETINDENMIIIKNKEIALFYKTFFQYLWARIPDKWLKYNARAESPDSIGSCSDGVDNDFDGKIDKADDSCQLIKHKSLNKPKPKSMVKNL